MKYLVKDQHGNIQNNGMALTSLEEANLFIDLLKSWDSENGEIAIYSVEETK